MNLFTTPQNNFRVFLNGTLIFGALGGTAGSTNCMIGEAFEDALKGVISGDHGMCTRSFLQLVAETVYKSGIMCRLLEVQKLDAFDIEGAIHAYYDIISEPCMVCRELGEEKVLHRYNSLHSKSLDESLKIVKDFLIAATAKDCSLMISFRPGKEGNSGSSYNSVYLESTNQTFDYKVHRFLLFLFEFSCINRLYFIKGIQDIHYDHRSLADVVFLAKIWNMSSELICNIFYENSVLSPILLQCYIL